MRKAIATGLAILAGLGVVYGVGREERASYNHKECVAANVAREQGNTRVRHLKLVEGAIIVSNEVAESTIPGYKYPAAVSELKKEDQEHPTFQAAAEEVLSTRHGVLL